MEIIVSARHMSLTESLKDNIIQRIKKLEKKYNKLNKAEVVLSSSKGRHLAEVVLRGKDIDLDAKIESENMYESIHRMTDKLDKQLQKTNTKKNNHSSPSLRDIERKYSSQ